MTERSDDPRLTAGFDMLRRTGARSVGLRYQDDEQPAVWVAVAEYRLKSGRPVGGEDFDGTYYDAAGAMGPVQAVLRLCERMVDGGMCAHCQRPTGLDPDSLDAMPLDNLVCWYQWDPELATFRRGCEGDHD